MKKTKLFTKPQSSTLKYGLNVKKQPAAKPKSNGIGSDVFGSAEDYDEIKPEASSIPHIASIKGSAPKFSTVSEAESVDPSVYVYDEVYDAMKDLKDSGKKKKAAETSEQKAPRYIQNLLKASETRKIDLLRAKQKSIQRERELEADQFADKEKFVTEAYVQESTRRV
ncbi:Nuclear speckle splicing regulatory protein 1 [Smittium culicis]|uniref:Nuclear speckle splicing regulatory protein 1 n=1 Tax=Smittium culicis TaxID=133412 RepID=A0A1R1Y831_9FUNG|nr:Nuclear speckle splicing regulatory protein 1 [Smittium culicis]